MPVYWYLELKGLILYLYDLVPASRKRISLEPKDAEAPNEATGSEVEKATEGNFLDSLG